MSLSIKPTTDRLALLVPYSRNTNSYPQSLEDRGFSAASRSSEEQISYAEIIESEVLGSLFDGLPYPITQSCAEPVLFSSLGDVFWNLDIRSNICSPGLQILASPEIAYATGNKANGYSVLLAGMNAPGAPNTAHLLSGSAISGLMPKVPERRCPWLSFIGPVFVRLDRPSSVIHESSRGSILLNGPWRP